MKKERVGIVISDKMQKSRVVQIETTVRHPLYEKVLRKRKKVYVHDEENKSKLGDKVKIQECRPLSRLKRWKVVEILSSAKAP